jgi:hypothetical protein
MKEFVEPLLPEQRMGRLTMQIGMRAMQNPDEVGAAAVDYLYFSGYVLLTYGHVWHWLLRNIGCRYNRC